MFSIIPGTIENNMLIPTDKLLTTFKKYNMKATFFIEAAFLLKLIELSEKHDSLKKQFYMIKQQIKQMVEHGHRVDLHLHPYWLDGLFDGKTWKIGSYRYRRLQDMPEEDAVNLFFSGAQLLEGIAREVDSTYNVVAFRAGSWCVEPFPIIKKCFKKTKVWIDSSVAPGIKKSSPLYNADFTKVHPDDYYFFSTTPTKKVSSQTEDNFLEVPITTFKRDFISKFLEKFVYSKNPKFGDGCPIQEDPEPPIKTAINFIFSTEPTILSLEDFQPREVVKAVDKLSKTKKIITFISRPKRLCKRSFDTIKALHETNQYQFKNLF